MKLNIDNKKNIGNKYMKIKQHTLNNYRVKERNPMEIRNHLEANKNEA